MLLDSKVEEGQRAKESQSPPEGGKGKDTDSPAEPPGKKVAVSLLTCRTLLQGNKCMWLEDTEIVLICYGNSYSSQRSLLFT